MLKILYLSFFAILSIGFLVICSLAALKVFQKQVNEFQNWVLQYLKDEPFFSERYSSRLSSFLLSPLFTYLLLIGFSIGSLLVSLMGQSVDYSYTAWFFADIIFQITATGFILLLAFLYPLTKLDIRYKEKLFGITDPKALTFKAAYSENTGLFLLRIILCLAVTTYFIFWTLDLYSDLTGRNIFSIVIPIVLVVNIIFRIINLFSDPLAVCKESSIALVQWLIILFNSMFILVPLVPLTMFSAIYLGLDEENTFNGFLLPFLFILFNGLLAYVEYKMRILYRKK